MPSTIQGRAQDLNFSATAASVASRQTQIRLRRRQRHFHGRHQRAQPIDRLIVEMAVVDAGIGDEEALRSEAEPDALGYAGKPGGERRPDGAVENPDRAEFAAPQQRRQPDQIDAAAAVPSRHARNRSSRRRRFGRKQFLGVARRRRQKRHAAARRDAGDGADEGQVPDDVADAGLDLDHGALSHLGHVACRAKGCDMRVVMQLAE